MQLVIDIILFLIYLSLFLLLCAYLWKFWLMYANQKYLNGLNWVVLEIKIPREVFKSPEAMEIVANAFLQGGGVGTWYDRNFLGKLPAFFSLEIESDQGEIKFYIRTEKKFKQIIQNNLYSQYPGIEVSEAEDYTTKIFYDHRTEDVSLWGITYKTGSTFEKEVGNKETKLPADFLPIRTYIDFRQDRDPAEEYEHDPITPILEWLGSLRIGEYGWYQIVVQDTGKWNGKDFPKTYMLESTHEYFDLGELAKMKLEQIRTGAVELKKKGEVIEDEYGNVKMIDNPKYARNEDGTDNGEAKKIPLTYGKDVTILKKVIGEMNLSEEDKLEIKRITSKLQKPLVRSVMRVAYLQDKSKAKGDFGQNIQSTLSILKQYTYPTYNKFTPTPTSPYNYKWQNTMQRREPWRAEEFYEAFVEREGFYPHIKDRKNVDHFADVSLFSASLGFRKKFRMLYEGFFDPFGHPHASEVFTLSLEELASLYHLPGQVATTPGLNRIDSTKVDAPSNLPI